MENGGSEGRRDGRQVYHYNVIEALRDKDLYKSLRKKSPYELCGNDGQSQSVCEDEGSKSVEKEGRRRGQQKTPY